MKEFIKQVHHKEFVVVVVDDDFFFYCYEIFELDFFFSC